MTATILIENQPKRQIDLPQSSEETSPRLLVVEDDNSTSIAIGALARKIGFVVTAVVSVEEAVKLLRTERYDCITLDLMLGKTSGVPLIRTIVETAPTAAVVIVSGSPEWTRTVATSLGKAAKLNVIETVTKPINFAKLLPYFSATAN